MGGGGGRVRVEGYLTWICVAHVSLTAASVLADDVSTDLQLFRTVCSFSTKLFFFSSYRFPS